MRASTWFAALVILPVFAAASDAPRFSGDGTLVEGTRASADGRFALQADIGVGDDTQRGGRFSLDARLAVGDLAKSATAACAAGGDIFKNGFE